MNRHHCLRYLLRGRTSSTCTEINIDRASCSAHRAAAWDDDQFSWTSSLDSGEKKPLLAAVTGPVAHVPHMVVVIRHAQQVPANSTTHQSNWPTAHQFFPVPS